MSENTQMVKRNYVCFSCKVLIKWRYVVVAICAVVNAIECSLKSMMAIAIVPMVAGNKQNFDNVTETNSFDWSPTQQGVILGAFFYGTLITHLFGGQIASLIGSRFLVAFVLFISSVLTFLTPFSAYKGISVLIAVRVATGLMQGSVSPAVFNLLSRWTRRDERSRGLAIYSIGGNGSALLSMPITSFLCEYGFAGGWPSAFYVYGIATFILFFIWTLLVRDSPEKHPNISESELIHISKNTETARFEKSAYTPWLKILTSIPVWAIVVAKFTSSWSYYMLTTKLPAYCDSVLGFSLSENGGINALVLSSSIVSLLVGGFLSDAIEKKGLLQRTFSRKLFEVCSQIGTGLSLFLVPFVGGNRNVVVFLLVLSMLFNGFYAGGTNPIMVDIAPDYSGTIYGLASTISSPAGFIAPLFVGFLLDLQPEKPSMWNYVFYASAGINAIGALVFAVFATSEVQKWGVKEWSEQRGHKHEEDGRKG
ncbi:Sialin-like protein [Dinothrombium tinctorium]|uniref:Sialin-like protein n=1 Tax=Dinothrombium tinctorium TaxID=1965070 RepID=A0A3S3NZT9_9ACAR|nr:Sialin-like protein [Dinothrombium tinctorium]